MEAKVENVPEEQGVIGFRNREPGTRYLNICLG
jgi:hypothetical protein